MTEQVSNWRVKPKGYRYGKWGGCPEGQLEDPLGCRFEVFPNRGTHYQCNRGRGHGLDGAYCKQHARIISASGSSDVDGGKVE